MLGNGVNITKQFKNLRDYKIHIMINISRDKKDLRRTFTVTLKNNKRLTINGLEQVSTKYLVIGKGK
jgi:hypothetical protein